MVAIAIISSNFHRLNDERKTSCQSREFYKCTPNCLFICHLPLTEKVKIAIAFNLDLEDVSLVEKHDEVAGDIGAGTGKALANLILHTKFDVILDVYSL